MLRQLILLFTALSLAACAGTKSAAEQERINDVMITFLQKAKAGFWKEAMENVCQDERSDMIEDGQVMQEYKDAINRIRLTTIKKMDLSLDRRGKLVGLKDILDESNEAYKASDEKVVIDPSKLEDLAAKRQKAEAEAAKREREASLEPEKSTWIDAYYSGSKRGDDEEAQEESEDGGVVKNTDDDDDEPKDNIIRRWRSRRN